MAQASEAGVGAGAGAKDQHTQHDHIGADEVSELHMPPSFYQKVREQAERFASIRLGQFVIVRADRALKLIEDTSKWSLPQEKNTNAVVLERPLPWAPFLMLIIMLRLARIWLSLGALMIGNGPVSPTDMIAFIRTRRRKLRAIRMHGLRVMRHRHQETSNKTDRSLVQQLSQWLSHAICRPGVQRENNGRLLNSKEQQQSPSVEKSLLAEKLEADQNLTFQEMLSKYANENSEDDADFVPNESGSSSSSSSSSSDSSEEISENEAKEHSNPLHNSRHVAVNNKDTNLLKEWEQKHEQEQEQQKEKLAKTTTTSNGNNDKEQTEVAQRAITMNQQEEWKSSPGHLSAAIMNTSRYNNTAAAGSPNNFNSCFGTPAQLRNVTISTVHTTSTPNSELEAPHSAGSELEEEVRQNISLAHQTEPNDTPPATSAATTYKQQQQRQFNQSHQRYRGRNRR